MIPAKLIDIIRLSQHITVLTGAGISSESGIPTFRDALTGFWANYDQHSLATEMGFLADPAFVWGWYEWRRKRVLNTLPNAGHIALANLATKVPKLTLITQNIDDLHERAGSQNIIHLHGSLHHPRCFCCSEPYTLPALKLELTMPPVTPIEQRISPPRCHFCNGSVRPGVVWFGEELPVNAWETAVYASQHCDLFLVVGTSGLVWPAANLPFKASQANIPVVQINLEDTELNSAATYNLLGKAGDILPMLYTSVFAS